MTPVIPPAPYDRSLPQSVARALLRPATYVGLAREAMWMGLHALVYPIGLVAGQTRENTRQHAVPAGRALRLVRPDEAGTPVILVHGYFHNRSAFLVMRRSLLRRGFAFVETWDYGAIGVSVGRLAERLAGRVGEVLERTGAERVSLVGHSLGGLIARYYVQELGGEHRVATCVTLGTPHRGTLAARVGTGRIARELRPDSALLRRLEKTARPMPVRFVAFYSNIDGFVIPASSAKIETPALRARNVLVKDRGHLSLPTAPFVLGELAAVLSGDGTTEPTNPHGDHVSRAANLGSLCG